MEKVFFWFRLNSKMFDISLAMGRKAQWEHLFSMYFDALSIIYLCFQSKA